MHEPAYSNTDCRYGATAQAAAAAIAAAENNGLRADTAAARPCGESITAHSGAFGGRCRHSSAASLPARTHITTNQQTINNCKR